ncbi:unnamed protein product [Ixodes pacificus]
MATGEDWCCAVGCNNTTEKRSNVTFHSFPTDKSTRKKWVLAVRRERWLPSKNSRICSDHFSPDCYDDSVRLRESFGLGGDGHRKKLLKWVVPTVFAHTQPGQPPIERRAFAKRRRMQVRVLYVALK